MFNRSYLGPDGLAEMGCYQNCTGGAALVIDKWLFYNDHLYKGSNSSGVRDYATIHKEWGYKKRL